MKVFSLAFQIGMDDRWGNLSLRGQTSRKQRFSDLTPTPREFKVIKIQLPPNLRVWSTTASLMLSFVFVFYLGLQRLLMFRYRGGISHLLR